MYPTASLASPLIVTVAQNQITAYHRETGEPVWRFESPSQNILNFYDCIRIEIAHEQLFLFIIVIFRIAACSELVLVP
jgi:glutamyl/glutaminyl-tRNA synthetase